MIVPIDVCTEVYIVHMVIRCDACVVLLRAVVLFDEESNLDVVSACFRCLISKLIRDIGAYIRIFSLLSLFCFASLRDLKFEEDFITSK